MKRWLTRLRTRGDDEHALVTSPPEAAVPGAPPSRREIRYFDSLPGRLLILSGAIVAVLFVMRLFVELPEIVDIFRKVASLALLIAAGWLGALAFGHNRRRMLWRVRRKLILSYLLLGFVPVVLVAVFALTGGVLLYTNVAAYVFHEGFRDFEDDVQQIAETSAVELGRNPVGLQAAIDRKVANLAPQYPTLSLAVVTVSGEAPAKGNGGTDAVAVAGPWKHLPPPASVPSWIETAARIQGSRGLRARAASRTRNTWSFAPWRRRPMARGW